MKSTHRKQAKAKRDLQRYFDARRPESKDRVSDSAWQQLEQERAQQAARGMQR